MTLIRGMITLLVICSFACLAWPPDKAHITSQKYYNAICKDLNEGKYEEADKLAGEWVKHQKVDDILMMYAVKALCEKRQYPAAVTLLKKIKWKRPYHFWGPGFIKYLEKYGMNRELELFLTYKTALDDSKYIRGAVTLNKTIKIYPSQANILFQYYNDRGRRKELFNRYEEELKKRPKDAALIVEYAYLLANYNIPKAVELLNSIDLDKLNKSSLIGLGRLSLFSTDRRLLDFSVKTLEIALQKKNE